MKLICFALLALGIMAACCKEDKVVKIACIGDSITEGMGTSDFSNTSYPAVLDELLGSNYHVMNAGHSGATMLKVSNLPYWQTNNLKNVYYYNPDIVVIKLGTNDTKPGNWNAKAYKEDYQSMIDSLKHMESDPDIYLCLPVPVYKDHWGINDSVITNFEVPIINALAKENGLKVIDAHTGLSGHPEVFERDGVHPDDAGSVLLAKVVKEGIGL